MYALTHDHESGILIAENSGFWTIDDTVQFGSALKAQLHLCRERRGIRLLIDSSAASIQNPRVTAALAQLGREIRTHDDDQIAVVVGSTLKRLQVRRIFCNGEAEIFNDRAAAICWLTREGPCQSA